MHEKSVMLGLIHQLEDILQSHGGGAVKSVELQLGALSHFGSHEHFLEHFCDAARGTPVEGAKVIFRDEKSKDLAVAEAPDPLLLSGAYDVYLHAVQVSDEIS